ncbi:hypothetical protein GPA27_12445 [Aromatoleum toluolicum]|uniref:Uncharacterized protein n=1 Tax=Aromatoleum toluolicum TaxID=90060 RepID=A0ABX1NGC1_9RHOO|nr:hypothetical protein [Aromatoleum toluolicum]NMF98195.1 hypothetical protein [Aromatoleum toluolicum]
MELRRDAESNRHNIPRAEAEALCCDMLRQWHTEVEGSILVQIGIEQPDEQTEGARLRLVVKC